jgi:hypothetical protein
MTHTPKPPKGTLWWVVRPFDSYRLSARKSELHSAFGSYIASKTWHRAGGLRLKPGAGPIRIRITEGWWERV